MKNKKLLIALTAVFSVVIFLATFLLVWYCAAIYPDFKSFEKGIEIPGLKDGAIPQGMGSCKANYEVKTTGDDGVVNTTNKVQTYFFVSAYMNDKSRRGHGLRRIRYLKDRERRGLLRALRRSCDKQQPHEHLL